MAAKQKGSTAERELVALLWEKGYAALRVAGSGSSRFPAPDVLAGKDGRILCFECKSITDGVRYIPKAEIDQLVTFSSTLGAEAFVAVRFNRKEWHFLLPEELGEKATLKLCPEDMKMRGLLLDELFP